MWPSSHMGDMIMKRLNGHKFPHWYKHFAYENAGHSLDERGIVGGTEDGNKQARIDAEQRIFAFLDRVSEK